MSKRRHIAPLAATTTCFDVRSLSLSCVRSHASNHAKHVRGIPVAQSRAFVDPLRTLAPHDIGKGNGYDVATLRNVQVDKADGKGTFRATLLLHGQTRQVTGTSTVHRRSDGMTHVDAEFPLRVSEFEIPKPTYLGIGVRDAIQVKVAFNASPVTATAATR